MDPTLWLTHRALERRERALWVRSWLETGTVPVDLLDRARAHRDDARRAVERWATLARPHRIRWLTPLDAQYPRAALSRLHDPPGVLFVRGHLGALDAGPAVGVVGARRGTARGCRVAQAMGGELARAGVTVVSGLALGVDAAAHHGCVDARGTAIAVLAGGLDRITPVRNAALGERVLERGLLISEHPPGTSPRPHDFVARNRVIAALCEALVVVEAAAKSGALTTLDFAQQVGATVMVVPGAVDCPHAQGVLAALRDGATPVRHAADVLDSLGLVRPAAREGPLGLGVVPETTAGIANRTGLPIRDVLARLGEAELLGTVRRAGADRWVAGASDLPGGPGRA